VTEFESMMHHPVTWLLAVGFLVGLAILMAGVVLMLRGRRTGSR
jgi:hypothetical protein